MPQGIREVSEVRPDGSVIHMDDIRPSAGSINHSDAAAGVDHHRDHDGEVEVDSDDDGGMEDPSAPLKFQFSWRKLWRFAGPGWLMSLAYLDPGNLESSLQQGAYTRFSLVWVLWWATVMGLVLQEMSARLGLVTGRGTRRPCLRLQPPLLPAPPLLFPNA